MCVCVGQERLLSTVQAAGCCKWMCVEEVEMHHMVRLFWKCRERSKLSECLLPHTPVHCLSKIMHHFVDFECVTNGLW
jgi:hypothetical protein